MTNRPRGHRSSRRWQTLWLHPHRIKKSHDRLGLAPGDYLEVKLKKGRVVMTPKTLVEKPFTKNLRHPSLRAKKYAEGRDLWRGRVNQGWCF